jgi:Rod binding domain-containing protein
MDAFMAGIDPLFAIGSNVNVNKVRTKEQAGKEFVSVFMSQMLKQIFKAQSSMFGEEGSLGAFSDNLYNDLLISKISAEMAESKIFDLDKMGINNFSAKSLDIL